MRSLSSRGEAQPRKGVDSDIEKLSGNGQNPDTLTISTIRARGSHVTPRKNPLLNCLNRAL